MALSATALCTVARAKYCFGGTLGSANVSFNAAEDTTIEEIIEAVSLAAARYCGRNFDERTYDEIHESTRGQLRTANYPITAITYLRSDPVPVCEITNTNSVTNQYATVQILSTGLKIIRQASAVTTTVTAGLDYAGNATLTALITAINAVGSNWSGRVIGDFGNWPSADLYVSSVNQPPYNARDMYAKLYMHTKNYPILAAKNELGTIAIGRPFARSNHDSEDAYFKYYQCNHGSLRLRYTAGYATIPDDLAEAAAEWTAAVMYQTKRDPSAGNVFTSTGGSSYQPLDALCPPAAKRILDLYRRRKI